MLKKGYREPIPLLNSCLLIPDSTCSQNDFGIWHQYIIFEISFNKQFPNVYAKDFSDYLGINFISTHLKKQSTLIDDEGVRCSVLPTQSEETLSSIQILSDVFQFGLEKSRYLPCLGTRRSVNDKYSWISYFEVNMMISALGSGITKLMGHRTNENIFVGITGKNSVEWLVTMHACAAYKYVYTPLYSTLGDEALQHILNQTSMELAVCETAEEAAHLIRDFSSSLRCVIICRQALTGEELKQEFGSTMKIVYFEEVLALGQNNPQPKPEIQPDDLCTLCYTSGSTGLPKGVMITHGDFVAGLKRVSDFFEKKFVVPQIRHISYLPLAHIFEQVNINLVILSGGRAGMVTKSPETLLSDMSVIRPNLLPSAPRVLTRIRSEFYKKFPKSNRFRKRLQGLIETKLSEQEKGIYSHKSLLDRLFFKKFRKALGGRVSMIISSSAALDQDVTRFFRAALGCPVLQIYGMTELTGGATGMLIGDCSLGGGAALMPNYFAKLKDVPEMDLVAIRDNLGEICFRGPGCTSGYYKDPENTRKLFDEEGWLRTGDIGKWNERGALEIVDRCKSMFKLAQGEYVAPEKVEGIYMLSSLVRIVLLEGTSTYPFAVVVVLPDFIELRKNITQIGPKQPDTGSLPNLSGAIGALSDEELCCNIQVRRFVLDNLNAIGRQRNLKGFELAKNILLTSQEFSPENGLLTPTLKIARFKAHVHFQEDIQKLYAEGELPQNTKNAV